VEAEVEARKALLAALDRFGRYSPYTAGILHELASIIFALGRYADAEALERAGLEIYANLGRSEEGNVHVARARRGLASALGAQGRWAEALSEYEAVRAGLEDDALFKELIESDPDYGLTLLNVGRGPEALPLLVAAVTRSTERLGDDSLDTATHRAVLAMAHMAAGDQPAALREFSTALPILSTRALDVDDDPTTKINHDRRLGHILAAYVRLLWDLRGTPAAGGLDVAAEAFRVAEAARSRSVERALEASAARTAATTPELRELVRKEQDARIQVSALRRLLADVLGRPGADQGRLAEDLRGRIETLSQTHDTARRQVQRDFPDYLKLMNPTPATIANVQAALRPDEALITTYVTRDRTFAWAAPQRGPVAFGASDIGESVLAERVNAIRRALEPNAKTVGDIPPFDVAAAHEIYRLVLEPVRSGWDRAESLMIVAHGPLAQLPFSLLPTTPVSARADSGLLFSGYRNVAWLVRTHAVTVLPSSGALMALRAAPAGSRDRRPFIGFGDPLFNAGHVREAAAQPSNAVPAAETRGLLTIRNLSVQRKDSSRLGMLPRLPDTADEIRAIASSMGADETRDVYLGERANEQVVRTLDLSAYRVIVFATHGLVPGDLDGLTQPALALTAPDVAKVPGDGLLTTDKIMRLKLDADWVVLSACNSAGGSGAGSEAISGLGRAFFYAGARALLVSGWPVETTSARALTTGLFRRQGNQPLPRAKALQQTLNAVIDDAVRTDATTNRTAFSYAHPIFWAPFSLVGDGR
jgi:CHAT domain-containing protein